jgi:hypothetical protein
MVCRDQPGGDVATADIFTQGMLHVQLDLAGQCGKGEVGHVLLQKLYVAIIRPDIDGCGGSGAFSRCQQPGISGCSVMQCMEVPVGAWWWGVAIYNEVIGFLAPFLRHALILLRMLC